MSDFLKAINPARNDLTACPHCGGENGFHTREVVDYKSFYEWGGQFVEGQHANHIRGGQAFYCCDCGRNVTTHTADGHNDD